jgi:hypothetical protein
MRYPDVGGGEAVTEQPEPGKTPSDITGLLFKAVKGLPEDEQRAVFEYFFERGIASHQAPVFGPVIREAGKRGAEPVDPGAWAEPAALAAVFRAQKRVGPERIMIPVRLSEAQHGRLKQWCAEHDFPMSVVVRGLIDRFLDSWERRAA